MIRIPVRVGKEDLFITSDSMQFMLTKELINKKGETTQSHMAHYPTLEGMLNYLLQRKLRCCDAAGFGVRKSLILISGVKRRHRVLFSAVVPNV